MFGLIPTMLVAQACVILPAVLWIAIRRYPVRATLRLYPINWRIAMWSAVIGLACWPVVMGMATLFEWGLALIGPGPHDYLPHRVGRERDLCHRSYRPGSHNRGTCISRLCAKCVVAAWDSTGAGDVRFSFCLIPLTIGSPYSLNLSQNRPWPAGSPKQLALCLTIIAHAFYNTIGTLFIIIPSLREPPEGRMIIAGVIALPIAVLLLWAFARQFPISAEASLPHDD